MSGICENGFSYTNENVWILHVASNTWRDLWDWISYKRKRVNVTRTYTHVNIHTCVLRRLQILLESGAAFRDHHPTLITTLVLRTRYLRGSINNWESVTGNDQGSKVDEPTKILLGCNTSFIIQISHNVTRVTIGRTFGHQETRSWGLLRISLQRIFHRTTKWQQRPGFLINEEHNSFFSRTPKSFSTQHSLFSRPEKGRICLWTLYGTCIINKLFTHKLT